MAYTKIFTINCHGVVASLVRNSTTITSISGTENEAISGNNLNMSNYITATACTPTYSASGLPTGLTINSSTGVISGTPTTVTSSNATITVSASGVQSITLTIPFNIEAASSSSGGGGGSFIWGTTQSIIVADYYDYGYSSGSSANGTYTYDSTFSCYIKSPSEYANYEYFAIKDKGDHYELVGGGYMFGGTQMNDSATLASIYGDLIGSHEYQPFMSFTISVGDSGGQNSSSSSEASSSGGGGLPTEPIGTEKLVISDGGGMVWSIYNGDYVIVAGTSSSTNSIWYNSSNGYYILYVDGYWRVDSDGVTPFDASIDTRLSPSDWSGVSDTTYNLRFTYSAGGSSGGGSFVWGTTQSFTISGSGSSAINTTYTWNTQSYAYKANNNDYYVTYMAGPDQASITYNQSMTEYYINGTGGDIGGTKTWSNLMSGGSETLTVTVIS